MGDHNNDPIQDTDDEVSESEQQDSGRGQSQSKKSGLLLEYSLTPLKNALVFTLHRQHPNITDFLNKVGAYHASNGTIVKLGELFPEWKESEGIIYLDGTNGRALNRPDITRLAPVQRYRKNETADFVVRGRQIRDNKMRKFQEALAELGDVVSNAYSYKESEVDNREVGRVRVIG